MVGLRKNKLNRIERMQRKLYDRNVALDKESRIDLEKKEYNIAGDWDGDKNDGGDVKKKFSLFWVVLIIATLFFLGSIGYTTYVFLGGSTIVSGDDVSINIVGPVSVGGGEKFSVDIVVQNNGPVIIESTDLIVEYPEGTKDVDLITEMKRERITIGDIKPGDVKKETLDMAFFGENGENKSVDIRLEYRVPGSNAFFNNEKTFEVALSAAPVIMLVNALDKVSSGQEIEFELKLSSNSDEDIENLMIVAEYPFGFSFVESSIKPKYGNNVWVLDKFSPDDKEVLKVKGVVQAQDDEVRNFRFDAGLPSEDNSEELGIIFSNTAHLVSIEKPFIDLALVVNNSDSPEIIVESGKRIPTKIVFSNNTNDIVRDVEIRLLLEGEVLNKSGINVSNGFYSSANNVVLFNKDSYDQLAEVEPRKQERMSLSLDTYDLSRNNTKFRNPEVKISAEVKGRRVSEDGVEENITETQIRTVKVQSDMFILPFTLYDLGPITNTGPVPPVVDQDTTYTVLWSLSNSSNNLENTKVVGTLPPYVSWNNKISPSSEKVTYDSTSRRIIWHVGPVSAGIGFVTEPREVNFQVTLRPSISQLGGKPVLISNTKLTADDTFVGQTIEEIVSSVNTVIQGYISDTFNPHEIVVQ